MSNDAEQGRPGFLNRWSARKIDQREPASEPASETIGRVDPDGALADSAVGTPVAQTPTETETSPEKPLLTDEDMPAIDTLHSKSDLSDFFNKGVSAALRRAALRHVFQQPEYNIRDGLNDYDGDYTVFEPLGDTITSDMKWHTARKERERLEAEKEAEQLLAQQEAEALDSQAPEEQAEQETEALVSQEDEEQAEQETEALVSQEDEDAPSGKKPLDRHEEPPTVSHESAESDEAQLAEADSKEQSENSV